MYLGAKKINDRRGWLRRWSMFPLARDPLWYRFFLQPLDSGENGESSTKAKLGVSVCGFQGSISA